MWKILGKDTIYLDLAHNAKILLAEKAADTEKGNRFKEILNESEMTYLLNGETEEHTFFINVPKDLSPEDIQIMADVVLDIAKELEIPFLTVNDVEQRYQVIITNYEEPEIIGLRRTPGYSSAEVFKPIFASLAAPGKYNSSMD